MNRPAAPWLFVVQAGCRDLFDRLAPRLSGIARVILDRRQGSRRRPWTEPVAVERRHGDRRRSTTMGPVAGVDIGYHLVYDAIDPSVSETDVRVPAVCAACGAVLVFEMPRFGDALGRVHLDVTHPPDGGLAQHVVDLKAVTGTGRTLLACRLRAKPNQGWDGTSPSATRVSPADSAKPALALENDTATAAIVVPLQTRD